MSDPAPYSQVQVKQETQPLSVDVLHTSMQSTLAESVPQLSLPVNMSQASAKRKLPPKKEMPLSCQRCRLRKVKCNFAHPCSSCVKLGIECIQVPNDMRKKRPPANYVLTLEKRIDAFLKFFGQLQKLPLPEERNAYIETNSLYIAQQLAGESGDFPTALRDTNGSPKASQSPSPAPTSKIRPVYGPTSVYGDLPEHKSRGITQKKEVREIATLRALAKDPDVRHCLQLFFTWQYPDHNMFVFREAFLVDFFDPQPNSLYCLLVLVLSICALGARMSDVDTIYLRSISYYNEARSSLLSSLEHPSITSVQSFLLLAFYDICNANNSTGWMLLGNAMRMGFDLGFQLNPEVWFLKHQGQLKDLDVAIRSRIYWGCFMADHFISLVLGRPSLLKLLDASIPETEDLPELDWIVDYKYIPENVTNISDPLKNIINLINISDNMLNDIFTKSDSDSTQHGSDQDHSADDYNLVSRLSKLFQYNAQIQNWKETLPKDLQWDRESLKLTSDNPTASGVRYYYYILLLCLNRPFVGISKDFKDKEHLSPAKVCADAIEDLYAAIQKFQLAHGLRRASIFIVYCSILSISVILLTSTTELLPEFKRIRLKYFLNVLTGCAKTWGLAERSYKMIASKLQLQFADDPDFKFLMGDQKKSRVKRQKKNSVPQATKEADEKEEDAREDDATMSASAMPGVGGPSSGTENSDSPASSKNDQISEVNQTPIDNAIGDYAVHEGQLHFPDFIDESNAEFFGGPPVLMTSDLVNEDWEALFPDSIFKHK